jgi:hypothetical protein
MKFKTLIAVLVLAASMFAQQKQCKKPVPPPPTPTPVSSDANTNTNSNTNTSTSSSTSTATASSNQSQSQQQSQTATGGNATATGGNATNGGQSNSQTYVQRQAAATAFSQAAPTAPCIKGYGGGVQGMAGGISLSGGKIDENCAALETARSYALLGSRLAACKVIVNTKASKKAHVTMEDCMAEEPKPLEVVPEVKPEIKVETAPPIVVVVPAPALPSPPEYKTVIEVRPPSKPKARKQVPQGCHYEPAKTVTQKLVCQN